MKLASTSEDPAITAAEETTVHTFYTTPTTHTEVVTFTAPRYSKVTHVVTLYTTPPLQDGAYYTTGWVPQDGQYDNSKFNDGQWHE